MARSFFVTSALPVAITRLQFFLRKHFFSKLVFRIRPYRILKFSERPEYFYYKHILSKVFSLEAASGVTHCVDVGCGNGAYLRIVSDFFPRAHLTGVEVDGGRRYWNFYRRIDIAQAYATRLTQLGRSVRVVHGDFRKLQMKEILEYGVHEGSNPHGVILFFAPFVSKYPCLRWGLPPEFVDFAGLLKKALQLAQESQMPLSLVSAHPGDWEALEAKKAYETSGLHWTMTRVPVEETQDFWPSEWDTWIFTSHCKPTRVATDPELEHPGESSRMHGQWECLD